MLLHFCGYGISFRRGKDILGSDGLIWEVMVLFWSLCILFPFAYPQSSWAKSFFFYAVSCLDSLLEISQCSVISRFSLSPVLAALFLSPVAQTSQKGKL